MVMEHNMNDTLASASYAALRQGGAPPAHASAQLGLGRRTGVELELMFQRRRSLGADPMRPRFARHDRHVRAVLAEGEFPVLPVRRR